MDSTKGFNPNAVKHPVLSKKCSIQENSKLLSKTSLISSRQSLKEESFDKNSNKPKFAHNTDLYDIDDFEDMPAGNI